jgi:hypothetical protein
MEAKITDDGEVKDASVDTAWYSKILSVETYLEDITSPEMYTKPNYGDYLKMIQTFDNNEADPKNVNDTISCAVQLTKFY